MTTPADPLTLAIRAAVAAELAALRDELLEALGARSLPKLLNRSELGQWLGVSAPTIRKLESEGMPVVRLGETFRYDVTSVQGWLNARGAP